MISPNFEGTDKSKYEIMKEWTNQGKSKESKILYLTLRRAFQNKISQDENKNINETWIWFDWYTTLDFDQDHFDFHELEETIAVFKEIRGEMERDPKLRK